MSVVIWVVIAVALAIGEVLTPGLFFLGPVALAAGAAALAALLGAGTLASLIVFIVCSVASLLVLRPIARRHVRMPALSRTGTDALIGRKAIVTRKVDRLGGRVRIGGEEWTASEAWKASLVSEVLEPTMPAGGTILEIGRASCRERV